MKKLVLRPTLRNLTGSHQALLDGLASLLDPGEGRMIVLPERIAARKDKIAALCMENYVQVRYLPSVTGTLLSMRLAIGPVTCLMKCSMYMYTLIESRMSCVNCLG